MKIKKVIKILNKDNLGLLLMFFSPFFGYVTYIILKIILKE